MSRDINHCEVCGKEAFVRCDDCTKCDGCGYHGEIIESPTGKELHGLCHYSEGMFCKKCYKKIVKQYIKDFDGDTSYTDNVVCPYCGYESKDSSDFETGDFVCYRCEKKFYIERDERVTFSTSKV